MNPLVAVVSVVGAFGFGGCLCLARLWFRQVCGVGDERQMGDLLFYRTALFLMAIVLVAEAVLLVNILF